MSLLLALASGGSSVTVSTQTGELVLTGFAPNVVVTDNKTVSALTGQLVLLGFAPTVSITEAVNVYPGVGELVIEGFAPTVIVTGERASVVADGYGRYDKEKEQRKRKELMYEDEMILAVIEAFVKII